MKAVLSSLSNIFGRQRRMDDPKLKNCLFVDKLASALDISLAALATAPEIRKNEELQKGLQEIHQMVSEELDELLKYCHNVPEQHIEL